MADDPTPEQQILQNALSPKKVAGDTGSAEQHPIADQIAADRYAAAKAAARRPGLPYRRVKLVPPSAD